MAGADPDGALGFIERIARMVFGGDDPEEGSGRYAYALPAFRVWVPDPSDVPGGFTARRDGEGGHYYDIYPDQIEASAEPDDFERVEPVMKGAVYVSGPGDAPAGAEVRRDSLGRHYYVEEADDREDRPDRDDMTGWAGDTDFEAPVWDPETIPEPRPPDDEAPHDEREWVGDWEDLDIPPWRTKLFVENVAEAATEKSWVPYVGPQGGEGWENIETGEVHYGDDPPGEQMTPEDIAEAALEAGIPADRVDEVVDGLRGESGEPMRADELLEDMSMALADVHLDEVTNTEALAEVMRNRAEREAGAREGDAYYEALREQIRGLDDDQIRNLAVATGDDPGEVFGTEEKVDPHGDAERARKAIEVVDDIPSAMTDRAESVMRERVSEEASRCRFDETVERTYGHVDIFRSAEERSGSLSQGRAAFRTVTSSWNQPDKKGKMWLADDTSPDTVSHEFAHALADAYAYDYQTGGSISHRYPSEGLPRWDFGPDGEHGRKREYMLTKYPDWEDRGEKGWDDYAERGERIDPDDASVGDRVALRLDVDPVELTRQDTRRHAEYDLEMMVTNRHDFGISRGTMRAALDHSDIHADTSTVRSMLRSVSDMDDDEAIQFRDALLERSDPPTDVFEGSVVPATNPVDDVGELEPGQTVSLEGAQLVSGRGWGTVTEVEDAEVETTVPIDDYIVIEEERTYPLPEGESPTEYEERPGVVAVIQAHENVALARDGDGDVHMAHAQHVTSAEGYPDLAVRSQDGEEVALSEDRFDDALLMAGKEDRDWVGIRERNAGDTWRGETVRFKFAAQDHATEGVVVDETPGQAIIQFQDEDGRIREKQINKSQAYNQQIWFAQDGSEFVGEYLAPDREPPGLREAKYESVDLTEGEVDWDTSIQYDDPEERLDRLDNGDLVLLRDPDGDRHVMRLDDQIMVEEMVDGQFERVDDQVQIQGRFALHDDWDSTIDAVEQTGTRARIGRDAPFSVMGVSKREEWTEEDRTAARGKREERWENVDVGSPEEILDLPAPENLEDHYDTKVMVKNPEHGALEPASVWQDEVSGTVLLSLHRGRWYIDTDDGNTLKRTGSHEEVGGLDLVKQGYLGERIDGGYVPQSADEVRPGATVEHRENDISTIEEVVEVDGGVIRTESAELTADDVVKASAPPGSGRPANDEEAVDRLMTEVNKAWHRMASRNEDLGHPDSKLHIGTGYSETNAHECLAKTHEVMQSGKSHSVANVFRNHPDLGLAYLDVYDLPEDTKRKMNERYEADPWMYPFDDTPFPEAREPSPAERAVTIGSTGRVPGGDRMGSVQGAAGGVVEVRTTDGRDVEVPLEDWWEENYPTEGDPLDYGDGETGRVEDLDLDDGTITVQIPTGSTATYGLDEFSGSSVWRAST